MTTDAAIIIYVTIGATWQIIDLYRTRDAMAGHPAVEMIVARLGASVAALVLSAVVVTSIVLECLFWPLRLLGSDR